MTEIQEKHYVEYEQGVKVEIIVINNSEHLKNVQLSPVVPQIAIDFELNKKVFNKIVLVVRHKIYLIVGIEIGDENLKYITEQIEKKEKVYSIQFEDELNKFTKLMKIQKTIIPVWDILGEIEEDLDEAVDYLKVLEPTKKFNTFELSGENDDELERIVEDMNAECQDAYYGCRLGIHKRFEQIQKENNQQSEKQLLMQKQRKERFEAKQNQKRGNRRGKERQKGKTEVEQVDIQIDFNEKAVKTNDEKKSKKFVLTDEEMQQALKEKKFEKGLFVSKIGKNKQQISLEQVDKIKAILKTDSNVNVKSKAYLFQITSFIETKELNELGVYYLIVKVE